MQSEALPIDWVFQPSRSQAVRRLLEWVKRWATRRPDRRGAPRKRVANVAANYFDGTAGGSHVVRDISTKGAFILADFKWMPGTILTLALQREGNRGSMAAVALRAKVVRSTPDGLGVAFLLFKKAECRNLADFLRGIPESYQSNAARM
jgi:hypothetical protein